MPTRFDPALDAHAPSLLARALTAAREAKPHAREVEQLRARLGPLPPVGVVLPVAATTALGGGWLAWAGLGALLVGGAVVWTAAIAVPATPPTHTDPTGTPARAAQAAAAPTGTAPPATLPPAQPLPVPAPEVEPGSIPPVRAELVRRAPRRGQPTTRGAPNPDVTASDVLAELALVQKAEHSLALSPRRSLALLDQHRQQYPAGTFAQEAEGLRVDALRALGRDGEARAQAEAFLLRFADSPQRLRLERLLQLSKRTADKNSDAAPPTLRKQEVRR